MNILCLQAEAGVVFHFLLLGGLRGEYRQTAIPVVFFRSFSNSFRCGKMWELMAAGVCCPTGFHMRAGGFPYAGRWVSICGMASFHKASGRWLSLSRQLCAIEFVYPSAKPYLCLCP